MVGCEVPAPFEQVTYRRSFRDHKLRSIIVAALVPIVVAPSVAVVIQKLNLASVLWWLGLSIAVYLFITLCGWIADRADARMNYDEGRREARLRELEEREARLDQGRVATHVARVRSLIAELPADEQQAVLERLMDGLETPATEPS